jgi:hypothetical protein
MGTKEATHKHSPVFRTSAAIVCLRSPESGALLMTYWVPPMEVSRERGAASHTSSHPTFPSALLVVQCPDKRVWPSGTFQWRPYLRLALKYTFPRARPKPANVGKNGPYPFTVFWLVPTTRLVYAVAVLSLPSAPPYGLLSSPRTPATAPISKYRPRMVSLHPKGRSHTTVFYSSSSLRD